MKELIKIGQLFYGLGIVALGVHQLVIKDFRSEILPAFPAWPHQYIIFPILIGIALIGAGIVISGVFKIKFALAKRVSFYLGVCFLLLAITCHLPYILFVSQEKALQLQVWFGIGEALAYGGGAFVMAGSFSGNSFSEDKRNFFESVLEKLIPAGRIFYSILIFLFGCSHFVYSAFVSTMVPGWIGPPMFWTYFVGVALIGSAIAIIFKIWIKPIALLLALMLFLFFLLFHVPEAIAKPYAGGGNEIVRAFVALLFCGIALVIASAGKTSVKV